MQQRLIAWLRPSKQERPKSAWSIWARRAGALALVGLSAFYLQRVLASSAGKVDWSAVHLAIGPLLISFLLTTLCELAGGWSWQLLLAGLGYPLPVRACVLIHVASNVAKYVPGYAWQPLSKAYLTYREQVPPMVVGLAVALEMGSLLLTGVLVALLAMPPEAALPLIGQIGPFLRWPLVLLAVGFFLFLPRAIGWFSAFVARKEPALATVRVHPVRIWGAVGIMVGAWVLLGIGLGSLMRALGSELAGLERLAVWTMTLSFLASLLALFVPGGIGVREGVMTYVLSARLPGGLAVVVSLLSRVVFVLSDLVAWGGVQGWKVLRERHNTSTTQKD